MSARDEYDLQLLERNLPGLTAARDFGAAYTAITRTLELAASKSELAETAVALLQTLRDSRDELRDLLASGALAALSELAWSVMVLAERTQIALVS